MKTPLTLVLGNIELLALIYLSTPLILFCLFWLKFIYAVVGALLLAYCFKNFLKRDILGAGAECASGGSPHMIQWQYFFWCFLVALIWAGWAGIGGFSFQNGDWNKHFGVLYDLATKNWPIIYEAPEFASGQATLIYYFGYYLVPGLVGKIFGIKAMCLFLLPYTAFGIAIGFYYLSIFVGRRAWLLPVLFIATSGLDILGYLYQTGEFPLRAEHIEWWLGLTVQYSAMGSLLFWVPQHLLALMMGVPLVLGLTKRKHYFSLSLVLCAMPLWSPMICVGLVPFILKEMVEASFFTDWRKRLEVLGPSVFMVFFFGIVFYFFYASGSNALNLQLSRDLFNWPNFLRLLTFYFYEFLIFYIPLGFILWKGELREHKSSLVLIAIVLMLIPFMRSTLWNDWAMRVSLPALYLLWSIFLTGFLQIKKSKLMTAIFVGYFLFSSCTVFFEFQREIGSFEWPPRSRWKVESLQDVYKEGIYKTQYIFDRSGFFNDYIQRGVE